MCALSVLDRQVDDVLVKFGAIVAVGAASDQAAKLRGFGAVCDSAVPEIISSVVIVASVIVAFPSEMIVYRVHRFIEIICTWTTGGLCQSPVVCVHATCHSANGLVVAGLEEQACVSHAVEIRDFGVKIKILHNNSEILADVLPDDAQVACQGKGKTGATTGRMTPLADSSLMQKVCFLEPSPRDTQPYSGTYPWTVSPTSQGTVASCLSTTRRGENGIAKEGDADFKLRFVACAFSSRSKETYTWTSCIWTESAMRTR